MRKQATSTLAADPHVHGLQRMEYSEPCANRLISPGLKRVAGSAVHAHRRDVLVQAQRGPKCQRYERKCSDPDEQALHDLVKLQVNGGTRQPMDQLGHSRVEPISLRPSMSLDTT
jgi:hypothetical protein